MKAVVKTEKGEGHVEVRDVALPDSMKLASPATTSPMRNRFWDIRFTSGQV